MLQILILVSYFLQENLKETQKNGWWNFSTEGILERVEFSSWKTLLDFSYLVKAIKGESWRPGF